MTTADELRRIADQLERAAVVQGIVPESTAIRVKDPASLIKLLKRAADEIDGGP